MVLIMGILWQVDIEYSEHLHDAHSDYQLAPETMTVPESWLKNYQHDLANKLGGGGGGGR